MGLQFTCLCVNNNKGCIYLCSPGHLTAQYNIGVNYFAGKGVENDMKKAAYYFDLAAHQGHVFAQV